MTHAVFTIVSRVLDGHEQALRELLDRIQRDHAGNGLIDFTALQGLHFSSLTLFPPDRDIPAQGWLLVFEHNVDGGLDEHLNALISEFEPGLRSIYGHCACFPTDGSLESLRRYLRKRVHRPNLHHIGTPYRRVATIQADLRLRRMADTKADELARNGARVPGEIWEAIWHYVRQPDPRGEHAPIPVPERRLPTRLRNWLVALVIGLVALAILTWGIWRLWSAPVRLSAAFVALFLVFGIGTALLLGWPVFSWDRERPPGESRRETRRVMLGGWRTTINIWLWFAVVGWGVSLVPQLGRLAGVHLGSRVLSALLLGVVTIVALAFMVGQWSLPTPQLGRPMPASPDLDTLKAQEDVRVINHMSAMVLLRPGRVRRYSLRLLLWTLQHTWFHTVLADVKKGRLFSFSTVHFAQWVVLDQDRYLFLSNYDHSFSRYLDDFGNISFGLARLWGMGARTPGLSSLERFKDFARTWMTPYSVWYAAYPTTAVTQVWNNEALRRGLAAAPASVNHAEMLQRLVNAKER